MHPHQPFHQQAVAMLQLDAAAGRHRARHRAQKLPEGGALRRALSLAAAQLVACAIQDCIPKA